MNIYTKSKAADHTLQLDLIKRNILPKKCSQCDETKILTSKKYDEQLNLTRSSIQNKLFEITEEFKEFIFQQNLQIELTKKMKFLKIKNSETNGLIQKKENLMK